MSLVIPTRIVPSAEFSDLSPRAVIREFRELLDDGTRLHVAGSARRNPAQLLSLGYTPRYRLDLFDTRFYFTNCRQNPELRFCVAYVVQPGALTRTPNVHARLFYKDLSLVWRAASHFSRADDSLWVGKGDVRAMTTNGVDIVESVESTTDLPLEMQNAVESLIRRVRIPRRDEDVIDLVLRRSPDDRIAPYCDFTRPRARAREERRNLINGGRKIARFRRRNDPTSLEFTPGFEPDFVRGILESSRSRSHLYGGALRRYRILSKNRAIQYAFIAGPKQVWIIPPQATTTELSSYGVRTIDVEADDDLFIPGYEYHYLDDSEDPPELCSQIPKGFAGAACAHDDDKADASPWLDKLPVVREFRRKVLKQRR